MSKSGESAEMAKGWATRLQHEVLRELSEKRSLVLLTDAFVPDRLVKSKDQRNLRLTLLIFGVLSSTLAGVAILIFHVDLGVDKTTAVRVFAGVLAISLAALFAGLHRILIGSKAVSKVVIDRGMLSELTLREYKAASAHRTRSSWVMIVSMCLFWAMLTGGVLAAIFAPSGTARVGGLAIGAVAAGMTLFIRSAVMPAYRHADEAMRRASRAHITALRSENTQLRGRPAGPRPNHAISDKATISDDDKIR